MRIRGTTIFYRLGVAVEVVTALNGAVIAIVAIDIRQTTGLALHRLQNTGTIHTEIIGARVAVLTCIVAVTTAI